MNQDKRDLIRASIFTGSMFTALFIYSFVA